MFERGLLERWGKRLFRIFKLGEQYGAKDYDKDRYDRVRVISGELQEFWRDESREVVYVPQGQLEQWSAELNDIAQEGLTIPMIAMILGDILNFWALLMNSVNRFNRIQWI